MGQSYLHLHQLGSPFRRSLADRLLPEDAEWSLCIEGDQKTLWTVLPRILRFGEEQPRAIHAIQSSVWGEWDVEQSTVVELQRTGDLVVVSEGDRVHPPQDYHVFLPNSAGALGVREGAGKGIWEQVELRELAERLKAAAEVQ